MGACPSHATLPFENHVSPDFMDIHDIKSILIPVVYANNNDIHYNYIVIHSNNNKIIILKINENDQCIDYEYDTNYNNTDIDLFSYILDTKSNQLISFNIWEENIIKYNLSENKQQPIQSSNTSLTRINTKIKKKRKTFCNKNNRKQWSFFHHDEFHILRWTVSSEDHIEHLIYNKQRNVFVEMNKIEKPINDNNVFGSNRQFIYNSYQERLYAINIYCRNNKGYDTFDILISYVDDLNDYKSQWKLFSNDTKKKWSVLKQIECELKHYTTCSEHPMQWKLNNRCNVNKYQCIIIYKTILLIELCNKQIWIDLLDHTNNIYHIDNMYLNNWRRNNGSNRYLFKSQNKNHYICVVDFEQSSFYQMNLLNIIPNELELQHRKNLKLNDLIIGYVNDTQNKENLFCSFHSCLIQLIVSFCPTFV